MLKTIYLIKEDISKRNIFIYGVNRDSVTVFTNLVFWGADVKGFIDDEEKRYVGEHFVNRPIISAEQVSEIEDAIIVTPDTLEKKVVESKIAEHIEIFYCEEIIVLNEELKKSSVYIYGIGAYGEKIYQQCCKQGITVRAACVTKKGSVSVWNNLPVYQISEIGEKADCAFIIATAQPLYQQQMLEILEGYKGDIYVYSYMLQHHISEGRFFQVIGKAVNEQKEIWLYEQNEELSEKIMEVFSRYSIHIQGKIQNLYDLGYDSIQDAVVVIAENDEYEVEQACNILDSLGFALEHWNYTSLACETVKCAGRVETSSDLLLRWSNVSNDPNYPGIIVHGNNREDDIRIMITGGSTSTDSIYRTESWVKIFYEKLISKNYKVTVFNSAACGHGCTRELLHLLRDGAYMQLDYVISLSGVNNTVTHGIKNYFSDDLGESNTAATCGLVSQESLYEFWLRNVRIMQDVVELYGAKYYSFLQPMAVKEKMSLFESVMHEARTCRKGMLEYRRRASLEKNGVYVNMIDLLDKKENMYIDNAHYSNRANELIADYIYEFMIKKEGLLQKNGVSH